MDTDAFFDGDPAAIGRETAHIDGLTLVLAYQQSTETQRLKEYIPADEQLTAWTRLASLREMRTHLEPATAAHHLIQALQRQNPDAGHEVSVNPTTGEIVIDLFTWDTDAGFAEFNAFKYMKSAHGIFIQQYAMRAYDDQQTFLRTLDTIRRRVVPQMAESGLNFHRPPSPH